MNRMTTDTSDSPVIIADNTEVIRILTDRGELHLLEVAPGEYDNVKFHHYAEADYWCQASHHTGHPEAKDNGYMLIKIPKTKMNKEEAAGFFLDMMVANREPGGVTTCRMKDRPPLKFN